MRCSSNTAAPIADDDLGPRFPSLDVDYASSAASAPVGMRSITRSNARAAPSGGRFARSQSRTVTTGTPIRRANSTCERPVRRRTRRAQAAASIPASALSAAAWRAISASVVLSTRAQSSRDLMRSQFPWARRRMKVPSASRRARILTIPPVLPVQLRIARNQRTGAHSTSSMSSAPVASMTRRSKPSAMPAAGGIPRSRAARKSSSIG
jgi:hypothetical protein